MTDGTTQEWGARPFPERCLRGLRDECLLKDENGRVWVSMKAFEPPQNTRNIRVGQRHKSDHYESSINWEDHLVESFQNLCDNHANTKCGIISVLLKDLEKAKRDNPRASTSLDWERESLPNNPFHGNLLFAGVLPRMMVRELAAVIATYVQENVFIIEPDQYASELEIRNSRITAATSSE